MQQKSSDLQVYLSLLYFKYSMTTITANLKKNNYMQSEGLLPSLCKPNYQQIVKVDIYRPKYSSPIAYATY